MLHEQIIKKLGAEARLFEEKDLSILHKENIATPTELAELLSHFKGAIIFARGAKLKTQSKIPVRDEEGYIDLDIIYGLNPDSNNIFLKNKTYRNQIDNDFYVFGESGGGDQFCISKRTEKIYYWYHEATSDDCSLFYIAPSFIEFIENLVPDDENAKIDFDEDDGVISAHFNF
ncbi:SMI1/KNR4 family protein [Pseudomonas sp. H3(2019)]|uniref:SMI1/KNR4 family protein n=1 Tax=Pseudomonas sp. H3(2019) TaxID=2598724 RepID=UPI0011904ECE|nr:SMI1/KNR4 family protein [Pseudomonas sp. H3(2019)]TVT83209.1 SMI1/KNR4 family protein [Pseudomonas sp. H3(2019)]